MVNVSKSAAIIWITLIQAAVELVRYYFNR